jgi:hypothetical protein
MAQNPRPDAPEPEPTIEPSPAPAPSPTQAPAKQRRWRARDLEAHASRWRARPGLIQAALAQAGTVDVGSPEEAKALVDAYLRTPLSRTYP